MQYRGLEFEEQEFNDCLNILHKEVVYDLSPLGDHDPFVWRLLEWPLYDYENFQFVIVQKLASYELDKLNEIIQVEDNKDNKDKRRL